MLQHEHAQAQDQIRTLKRALDAAAAGQSTPSRPKGIEAFDANGHKKRMGEILVELGLLDEAQLKSVLKEQNADPAAQAGPAVVEHGYTGEDVVARIAGGPAPPSLPGD